MALPPQYTELATALCSVPAKNVESFRSAKPHLLELGKFMLGLSRQGATIEQAQAILSDMQTRIADVPIHTRLLFLYVIDYVCQQEYKEAQKAEGKEDGKSTFSFKALVEPMLYKIITLAVPSRPETSLQHIDRVRKVVSGWQKGDQPPVFQKRGLAVNAGKHLDSVEKEVRAAQQQALMAQVQQQEEAERKEEEEARKAHAHAHSSRRRRRSGDAGRPPDQQPTSEEKEVAKLLEKERANQKKLKLEQSLRPLNEDPMAEFEEHWQALVVDSSVLPSCEAFDELLASGIGANNPGNVTCGFGFESGPIWEAKPRSEGSASAAAKSSDADGRGGKEEKDKDVTMDGTERDRDKDTEMKDKHADKDKEKLTPEQTNKKFWLFWNRNVNLWTRAVNSDAEMEVDLVLQPSPIEMTPSSPDSHSAFSPAMTPGDERPHSHSHAHKHDEHMPMQSGQFPGVGMAAGLVSQPVPAPPLQPHVPLAQQGLAVGAGPATAGAAAVAPAKKVMSIFDPTFALPPAPPLSSHTHAQAQPHIATTASTSPVKPPLPVFVPSSVPAAVPTFVPSFVPSAVPSSLPSSVPVYGVSGVGVGVAGAAAAASTGSASSTATATSTATSSSIGLVPSRKTIFVWDLDETLIIFSSLLFQERGKKYGWEPTRAAQLGKEMSDNVFFISDTFMFFPDIEKLDQMHIDLLADFDDEKVDVATYKFKEDGFTASAVTEKGTSLVSRTADPKRLAQLAHRFRYIKSFYQTYGAMGGLMHLLPPERIKSIESTLQAINDFARNWLSAAHAALMQTVNSGGLNVLVSSGHIVPTLAKLMLFGISPFFDVDCIYSSCGVNPKLKCFEEIVKRFGTAYQYVMVGDGDEERDATIKLNEITKVATLAATSASGLSFTTSPSDIAKFVRILSPADLADFTNQVKATFGSAGAGKT